jgi:hypothetical protein
MMMVERKMGLIDWIIHLEQESVLEILERLRKQQAGVQLSHTHKQVTFVELIRTSPLMEVELDLTRDNSWCREVEL